jgi:hypothetical protein
MNPLGGRNTDNPEKTSYTAHQKSHSGRPGKMTDGNVEVCGLLHHSSTHDRANVTTEKAIHKAIDVNLVELASCQ